jgi:3-keto-5-aminohexanoate cleavage enzyme
MGKLIIEARINEYMMREQGNAHVPYTAQEIAADAFACREAGAAIVHFHARKADGSPEHSADVYADTIRRIRTGSDILVHPTLGYNTMDDHSAPARLRHILELAKDKAVAPHFVPLDMGSVNVDRYDPQARRFLTTDHVYANPTGDLMYFARQVREAGLKPYLTCFNIGFLRYANAFADMGLLDEPLYMCLVMTDSIFLGGHPASLKGLQSHLDHLPAGKRVEWTAMTYGGNLFGLVAAIIAQGGHVSIGLGDHPYKELGMPTNAELIRRVVAIAHECGRAVATPAEAWEILHPVAAGA